MKTVYFIVDESGAKGFSSNVETELGEFGIAAGYFVREELLRRVRDDFNDIRDKAAGQSEGKSHIVDLTPGQQRLVRQQVFEYLIDRDMYCCYEALYVQGLHASTNRTNAIPRPNVKRPPNEHYSEPRPENPRLISEIFSSLLAKAMAYAVDTCGREVTLKVIVDTTDARLLNEYREGAQQLLDVFKSKTIRRVGWNSSSRTKIIHEAELRTKASRPEAVELLSRVGFDIECDDSGLTFGADALVGSLRHHLMNRVKSVGPGMLNSKDAIAGHPLAYQMFGASSVPSEQSLLDTMYPHPARPKD
jgi:hypothetical protein